MSDLSPGLGGIDRLGSCSVGCWTHRVFKLVCIPTVLCIPTQNLPLVALVAPVVRATTALEMCRDLQGKHACERQLKVLLLPLVHDHIFMTACRHRSRKRRIVSCDERRDVTGEEV